MSNTRRLLIAGGAALVVLVIGAGVSFAAARHAPAGGRPGWAYSEWGHGEEYFGGPGWHHGGPGMMGPGFRGGPGMMGPGFGFGPGDGADVIPNVPAAADAVRTPATISIGSKLDPTEVNGQVGQRLVLTVKNDGTQPIDFVLPGLRLWLHNLAPGSSKTVELNLDRAGTYPYVAAATGSPLRHQQGTLTVTEKV